MATKQELLETKKLEKQADEMLRLQLVGIFMQIPQFLEFDLTKQENIIEYYFNYVRNGATNE